MMIINEGAGGTEVQLSANDAALLINVLNEVCNGLRIVKFESLIGASRQEAKDLLRKVAALSTDQPGRITATREELSIVHSALRETLRRLGRSEFSIRTSVSFESGEEVLRDLQAYLS